MKNTTLRYLGKISYGLYVYHIIGLAGALNLANSFLSPKYPIAYPAVVVFTTFLLTLLISAVSYQFLEKPFLKVKSKFTFVESRAA